MIPTTTTTTSRHSGQRGFGVRRRARGVAAGARGPRRERGVALIAVLVAIAISLAMSNEFSTNTTTDLTAAANYQDQMRAHFLARSALDLSELVIRLQQRLDGIKQLKGVQITDYADQLMLAFCGNSQEVQDAIGFSTADVKGLGADVGVCGISPAITTEDDKTNLNCANGNDATAAALKSKLDALLYFQAYDSVFDEADGEGWRRTRDNQVASIVDYIDGNSIRLRDRGTSEDYGYENLKDDYKPKNNYIDTVGEARLARGVDDRFWSLFGQSFTAYGSCKTNISAVTNPQVIAALLYLSAKNPNDPILADQNKLFMLAGLVAKARQFGMPFTDLDDFIDFVKDPSAAMLSAASSGTGTTGSTQTPSLPGLPAGVSVGLELDKAKLAQIASAGARRTYRVSAWGEIPRPQVDEQGNALFPPIRRTLTGVWDTKVVNQNPRKPEVRTGTWVFLREE